MEIPDAQTPDWLEHVMSVQHRAGANQDQINQMAYWFTEDYGGHDVKFPGGYAGIFDALEGDYAITLSTRVTQVLLEDDAVILTTEAGESSRFDAVIVTLPLGVLKSGDVTFSPALPDRKQQAIERLGMGLLDKVYLRFDEVFWDDETWIGTPENGLPRGHFNQWLNLHRYIGEPVILAFNGGPPAWELAARSDEEIINMARQTLDRAYPRS